MSAPTRLLFLAALVSVAIVTSLAAPNETPVSSAPLQPTPTLPPDEPAPCDPKGTRFIEPVVMEAGSEFGIETWFDYKCSSERQSINFMFVVEHSIALRSEGIQPLRNLQTAMGNFVNKVDWDTSTGGLLLYVDQWTVRATLQGGVAHKTALSNAITGMSGSPIGQGGVLPAPAIRHAAGLLPTEIDDENTTNVVIVVDAGGEPLFDGGEGTTMATVCGNAQDANTRMVVVALAEAGGYRLHADCVDQSWLFLSRNDEGEDLTTIFETIADRLLTAEQVDAAEYSESLLSTIEYQHGSSSPMEPVHIGSNEWNWPFTPPIPAGGQFVHFRLKVDESVGDSIFEPSLRSEVLFSYNDGSRAFVRLPDQKICVYRQGGDPSFCDGAFTPTPGTPTATPTETPTLVTPTDTPTPEPAPTDTPEPPVPAIYLPMVAADAPIG